MLDRHSISNAGHSETRNQRRALGGFLPMNFPSLVILSAAKNPMARPHAYILLDSSLALRMTNQGVHQQRSEESKGTPAPLRSAGPPAGFFAALRMTNEDDAR